MITDFQTPNHSFIIQKGRNIFMDFTLHDGGMVDERMESVHNQN
jgi:hypothetical protein